MSMRKLYNFLIQIVNPVLLFWEFLILSKLKLIVFIADTYIALSLYLRIIFIFHYFSASLYFLFLKFTLLVFVVVYVHVCACFNMSLLFVHIYNHFPYVAFFLMVYYVHSSTCFMIHFKISKYFISYY